MQKLRQSDLAGQIVPDQLFTLNRYRPVNVTENLDQPDRPATCFADSIPETRAEHELNSIFATGL
jgi:hypothetical protein